MATTTYALPNAAALAKTLEMLFGGNVPVTAGKPLDVKAGSGNLVATYVDDDDQPVAVAVCDVPFAANAGSALSMLPVAVAKDAIKTRKPEQAMLDNLYEVMNILSTMLMNEHTPHLKLAILYPDPGKLPAEARALLGATKGRADFNVSVPRYGNGGLSLLTL